ncbi:hypothetical protein GCM10023232_22680 [Sphingosinicella ginsenosidimutans]|uniref:Atxe2 family lasso peptide isopeptidase n=1 Tax=Allosphingosinicella ginsenosidimutans TaxID=1176539 RepID=UPI0031E5DECF
MRVALRFGLAAAWLMVPSAAMAEDCRARLVSAEPAVARDVTPRDLVELRDFGRSDTALSGPSPFSLSPDGTELAIALRRADPDTDRYCIGIVVVPLDRARAPRLIDVGGEFILARGDSHGVPDLPVGTEQPVTPLWSPDGRWLVYLRRDRGVTQAWRARRDGSYAGPVTHDAEDVRAVRWSEDGKALVVTTRPMAAANAAIEREGRRGFLYDRRFWTLSEARPRPRLPLPTVERLVDPDTGRTIEGGDAADRRDNGKPAGARLYARSADGARAWTSPTDPGLVQGPTKLQVEASGRTRTCTMEACADAVGALWWRDPGELLFMQGGTPENGGTTTLYRWRIDAEPAPVALLATTDALIGCQLLGRRLVCARETPTRPRVIVSLDPDTGRSTTIYDPNPEFARLRTGTVQRLRWTDPDGVAGYGDLVLPPSHRPGDRHPLVIVQYQSRGFLRGGTGDEYPIHALASRGFAVLSFNRVRPYASDSGARDLASFIRIGMTGFAERRRMLSAIETGIDRSIALGVVDPARIGISGLSDGAASVQFALINSTRFRAAAMSSCCDDPSSVHFAAGLGYLNDTAAWGYPGPGADDQGFWRRYSLAANADRIDVPILLQLPDDEYRFAIETYVTLDRNRVPIEMHVFPDEYHVKWHPAHRLAIYDRAIDWFDFWLNGREDPAPAKREQYSRWRALAARSRATPTSSAATPPHRPAPAGASPTRPAAPGS